MIKKSKKVLSIFLVATIMATMMLFAGTIASAATYSGYILGYFQQVSGGYGLFLAYSTDGYNWTSLNGGNAVVYPTEGTQGLRDPFIFRKQDGTFGVVGTDMLGTNWGDWSYNIHYWESSDLCSFSSDRLLRVHDRSGMHAWAPKVFYNYDRQEYGIIWSGNTDYNRIYVNYTTDFNNLSSNQVFFDPGYDVIDASMVQHSGTAYLFFKDERPGGKAIKAARSSSAEPGTFSVYTPDFLTSSNTEGPMPFKDNNTNKWYLYADLFAESGNFEMFSTTDLNATSWTREYGYSLPSGVRHGSVVPVTQAELDNIVSHYNGGSGGGSSYVQIRNRATNINIDGYGYTDNGAVCNQYSDNTHPNQQWVIESSGSYVRIRNRSTGLYLDGMGRTGNGSDVGQWSNSGSYNQQWAQESVGGGYYKFRNRATGLYLDGMGRTSNGSALGQWSDSGSYNQQWYIEAP